jgi:hypothetical protein
MVVVVQAAIIVLQVGLVRLIQVVVVVEETVALPAVMEGLG